ncbi:class I SAM-dependent methyltransferase [Maritalea sp.]|uniref:class I SAM-dependent methyltransferase n=1 Tax=Maritalea sp. TaxID=2003361 RepID=UPI003EF249AA
MTKVHKSAATGYQSAADRYQRGRPDYSPKILNWLREELGIERNSTVLDLGAGTGKFTKRLVEICDNVIAVEPVAEMRGQLAKVLPNVKTFEGTSTQIPLDDASVDFVICAQSFHWFSTPETMTELHRVLKPNGRLGLVWNVRNEKLDWVSALTKIVTPYEGDAPRYYKGDWKTVFPCDGFGELQEASFAHEQVGDPEDVIMNRFMSVSFIAAQDKETRASIRKQIDELITSHLALKRKREISFPYVTECFWCGKI